MIPVLVLLISAAMKPEATASSDWKYVAAYPENIAYYHPNSPENKLYLTALENGTKVKITSHSTNETKSLSAGKTETLEFNAKLELKKKEVSNDTIFITSNKKIIAYAVSSKNSSMQTSVLIAKRNMGTSYFIPPIPTIVGTTDNVDSAVTERQPFKLILINADAANTVTIEGANSQTLTLESQQVRQIYLYSNSYRVVRATEKLGVIFGHPCAIRENCTCSLLYTVLSPAPERKLKYYIPPSVAGNAKDQTFVLLSDGQTQKQMYDPNSPMVETAGTVVLYRPGLLLNLIPESDFAACFLINAIAEAENVAVIVVHKNHKDGIYIGDNPLEDPDWKTLPGTDYVSTAVGLTENKNVIWHSYDKMAVYYQGRKENSQFGNPAAVISKDSDYNGCVVTPEDIYIGEQARSWQESVEYCKEKDMKLISFPDAAHQKQIFWTLKQTYTLTVPVWIGYRRSSQTGDWYWLNKVLVSETNWAVDEPGTVLDGQCAVMSMEDKDYSWSDKDCCSDARPVCHKAPTYFHERQKTGGP